jgi:predicted cupin superfamily sugar epimerase
MDRVQFLRETLRLSPHPEGGSYRETWRSFGSSGESRSPLTLIYFLLASGERSRWHRVDADEVWLLHEGSLELWTAVEGERPTQTVLSKETVQMQAVVPKGVWQAARPIGTHALVSCAVAPGFEFAGFEMLEKESLLAQKLLKDNPQSAVFL